MKWIVPFLALYVPVLLAAQGTPGDAGILYTLANGMLTSDSQNTYYEFDVMAQMTPSDHAQTRLGSGFFLLKYSWPDEPPYGSAFGTNISGSGSLTITKGTLTQDYINPPLPTTVIYSFIVNNNSDDVLAITFKYEQAPSSGWGSILPVFPTQLAHIKMKVQNPDIVARICFSTSLMSNQTFYEDESTYYVPVEVGGCLNQDPPLPVELSYFSCVMGTANTAVNLTWVSQTETGMVGYRIYRGDTNVLEQAADQEVLIEATNSSQSTIYFFSDTNIESDHQYHYWLEALDLDGSSQFFGPTSITTPGQAYYAPEIPLDTGLTSIYPNPFNPDLTIQYTLDQAKDVQIYVSNIRGQIVRQLVSETKDRGVHQLIWDGRDNNGNACSSGVFYIRMLVGGKDFTRKAILLK